MKTYLLTVHGASNKRSKSASVNIYNVVHYMWSHPQLEHHCRLLALFINCFLNIYVCMCYTFLKLNTGLKLFPIKIFPSPATSILIYLWQYPLRRKSLLSSFLVFYYPISHYIQKQLPPQYVSNLSTFPLLCYHCI